MKVNYITIILIYAIYVIKNVKLRLKLIVIKEVNIEYRGPACGRRNLNLKKQYVKPVVFYNGCCFDFNLLFKENNR